MVMVAPLAVGYAISCTDRFKKILFLFLGALICASIFLSGSRGGALSVISALCGIFILLQHYDVIRRKAWVVFAGLAAGVVLMGIVGLEPLKERFLINGMAMGRRLLVLRDASAVAKDFPLWGVGLGNFHHIFTMYRSSLSPSFWYYLHNDHFQLVLETGVITAGCYFYFLILIFHSLFKQLAQRHDPFVLGVVAGGACGLLGVLLHSFFDFNFHIPAICFLFWLLLGVTYKCAHTHFEQ
ncbi:MAG: O-antigen ligase family protein, partial [Candidatus Omnitrophica bacterium]|nr:O-antigen ligase family protein [Candidatus Omnitrophota bacterium]